jgi:hypothetical protein
MISSIFGADIGRSAVIGPEVAQICKLVKLGYAMKCKGLLAYGRELRQWRSESDASAISTDWPARWNFLRLPVSFSPFAPGRGVKLNMM